MTAPPGAVRSPRGELHFVLNGAAGDQDDDALLASVATVMNEAGRPFRVHRAPQPSALFDTTRTAASLAGSDGLVVAVGGDGTINTVATTLLGGDVAMGLVPRGTFNYVARAHGIPLEAPDALRLLLEGQAHPTQVGRLNDRPFLVNASLGLYPDLLEDREAFKKRFGRTRLIAFGAALKSMWRVHQRLALSVQVDGRPPRQVRATTLFVGNNALQLQALGLPEADRVGHRGLAALALRAFRPGELLWLALRGALGRLGGSDDLIHFPFHQLTVAPRLPLRRSIKVAVDGEVLHLRPPLQFSVHEHPLWLVHPLDAGPAQTAATAVDAA